MNDTTETYRQALLDAKTTLKTALAQEGLTSATIALILARNVSIGQALADYRNKLLGLYAARTQALMEATIDAETAREDQGIPLPRETDNPFLDL